MDWSELEAVYERYHQQLYRYCFSIVGNAEDAQDALQNAMVKAVRALPDERREIQLKPWLFRIAHNESIELLRKRRDRVPLGPDHASSVGELVEIATQRDRLRRLLGDLEQLPERQRGALVMREMGGLEFEQIGEAFGSSAAVARQTVYEARLSLRQLEAGREMSCEKVMRELSDADGRITRRRDIQAHLRDCAECSEFGDSISARRRDLAAIAPLPAAASSALLHSVLGGGKASAGLSGGSAIASIGKTAAGSVAVKSAATVAVVAVLGASVADRSGLVDISGSNGSSSNAERVSASPVSQTPAQAAQRAAGSGGAVARRQAEIRAGTGSGAHVDASTGQPGPTGPAASQTGQAGSTAATGTNPVTKELPAASSHGQETAAAHGGGPEQAGSKAGGSAKGQSSSHSHAPSQPPGRSKSHPESPGAAKGPPESPGNSGSHAKGGPSEEAGPRSKSGSPSEGVGPDSSGNAPFQPSEPPKKGQGSPGE
jgi:RNA polymerase sigma factor (sigma-70 family)